MNIKTLLHGVGRSVIGTLVFIGVGTVLAFVLNFDVVQHWLAQPQLDIEILHWNAKRDPSRALSEQGSPTFDEVEVMLNIIPRVKFHPNQFPVNQVKSISVRKGEWFGLYRIDREVPFSVRDEPISLTLHIYQVPIEGPKSGKNVEIKIVDRWGRVSVASIEDAF